MAMDDEKTAPVCGRVDGVSLDGDVPVIAAESGDELVVIPGNVDDARPFAGLRRIF